MRRVISLFLFVGIAGLVAVLGSGAGAQAGLLGAADLPTAVGAGMAGAVAGLAYASFRGGAWQRLVWRARLLRTRLHAQFWWAVLGCASLAVLVYY